MSESRRKDDYEIGFAGHLIISASIILVWLLGFAIIDGFLDWVGR